MGKKIWIIISIFLILGVGTVFAEQSNIVDLNLFSKATPIIDAGSYVEIMKGNVPGHSIVNKFGRNPEVSTLMSFISISGEYQTPLTAQTLEILSSDVDDTYNGTGAWSMIVFGLDEDFKEISSTVNLNGTTPVELDKQFIRVFRAYVISSGTYATTSVGSHEGTLTLRNSGGGVIWTEITIISGMGIGQSQIGAYTIPVGYTAYLLSKSITIESNKPTSLYFFKRENSEDTSSPHSGIMRLFEENDGLEVPYSIQTNAPLSKFPERTDVGFFAKTSIGTASVSTEFQLLLVEN